MGGYSRDGGGKSEWVGGVRGKVRRFNEAYNVMWGLITIETEPSFSLASTLVWNTTTHLWVFFGDTEDGYRYREII